MLYFWRLNKDWARSSVAERTAHNRLVAGSNPAGPTFDRFLMGVLCQLDTHYFLKSLIDSLQGWNALRFR